MSDNRLGPRTWRTQAGMPPKLTYEDILRVRELYAFGRTNIPKPLSVEEIAEKFDVSHMTVRRAVKLDAIELEMRRKLEL